VLTSHCIPALLAPTPALLHCHTSPDTQVGQEQEVIHLYEPIYKDQRRVAIELLASAGAPE
jgi:hypothetical protein